MERLLKISQQTLWQILGKIITSLSTFIILGLVARIYGKEGLGVFTLSLTYLGIFMLVCDFGFNGHILRTANKGRVQQTTLIFKKLLGTRIIWSAFLIVFLISLLPFFRFVGDEFIRLTIVGSLAILGSAIFMTGNLVFQQKLLYQYSSISTIIGTAIYLILIVIFTANYYSLYLSSISFAVGWLLIGLTSLVFTRLFIKSISPVFDLNFSLNLVKKSWPIAATLLLNVIYFRADSFMVAYYKNITDVGIYNLSFQFFQAILVLPTFIMNSYYPLLLKSYAGFRLALAGLIALSVIGTFITIISSPLLITLMTGEGFEGSVISLRILALGFPAYFVSALFMWTMVVEGRYKAMLLIYSFGLILNIVLNLIYIPQYSYQAAAWTTVLSEYVIVILQIFFVRKALKDET